ncbi:tetratricopeptide repeat protein [Paenibacillus spiritus]|nr:O-antigen ligase family protein [Paenibacillus spiritus]
MRLKQRAIALNAARLCGALTGALLLGATVNAGFYFPSDLYPWAACWPACAFFAVWRVQAERRTAQRRAWQGSAAGRVRKNGGSENGVPRNKYPKDGDWAKRDPENDDGGNRDTENKVWWEDSDPENGDSVKRLPENRTLRADVPAADVPAAGPQAAQPQPPAVRRAALCRGMLLACPLSLAGCYALAWLRGPVSAQGTMNELLRWSLCAAFAAAVLAASRSREGRRLLLLAWHGTGLLLALSGLLAVCAGLPLPGAVLRSSSPEISTAGARLGGLLQYPNTYGALMAAFALERLLAAAEALLPLAAAGPTGQPQSGGKKPGRRQDSGFAAAAAALLTLFPYAAALLLSESRGAWAAGAAGLAAALCVRPRLAAPVLAAGAPAALAAALLWRACTAWQLAPPPGPGLVLMAGLWAGAVCAGCGLGRRAAPAARGRGAALAAAALGWAAAAGVVLLPAAARGLGPSSTAAARGLIARDAWRLAAEAPWLGRGGEVWRGVYRAVQSSPYVGSQVHSGVLDLLLGTGAAGLAVAGAGFAAAAGLAAATPRWLAPLIVLAAHAAVDFDGSFLLVPLLTVLPPVLAAAEESRAEDASFVLPGVLPTMLPSGPAEYSPGHNPKRPWVRQAGYAAAGLGGVCLLGIGMLSFSAWRGETLSRQAAGLDEGAARDRLVAALEWNPRDPSAAARLARLLPAGEGLAVLERGLRYSPEEPRLHWLRAVLLLRSAAPEPAIAALERSLELDRFSAAKQTEAARLLLEAGQRCAGRGELGAARRYAQAGRDELRRYAALAADAGRLARNDRAFVWTPEAAALAAPLERLERLTAARTARSIP